MAVVESVRHSLAHLMVVISMTLVADISCAKKNPPQTPVQPPIPKERNVQPSPVERRPPVRPGKDPRLIEIVDILWESPLGRTLFDYMFGAPPNQATARDVVDRVLSGGGKAVTRMSALQLMLEELYDTELMGDEQRMKLEILRGDLLQRQMDLATHPTENIAYIASTAFLTLLPLGEGAKTFELKWVIGNFFKYFGPFSFLYFFWFDWKESTRGHSIPYNLETLKSDDQYQEFLKDIRDL